MSSFCPYLDLKIDEPDMDFKPYEIVFANSHRFEDTENTF